MNNEQNWLDTLRVAFFLSLFGSCVKVKVDWCTLSEDSVYSCTVPVCCPLVPFDSVWRCFGLPAREINRIIAQEAPSRLYFLFFVHILKCQALPISFRSVSIDDYTLSKFIVWCIILYIDYLSSHRIIFYEGSGFTSISIVARFESYHYWSVTNNIYSSYRYKKLN